MSSAWSWALFTTSVLSLAALSVKPKRAWGWLAAHQALWFTYSYSTKQWGFFAMAIMYSFMYLAVYNKSLRDGTDTAVPPLN